MRFLKYIMVLAFCLSVRAGNFDAGILVALKEDIMELSASMNDVGRPINYGGRSFHHLTQYPEKYIAVVSRAGLQESCFTADAVLMKFKADRIISIGVTGALTDKYKQGDIVVIRSAGQLDRGTYNGLYSFAVKDDALSALQWDSYLEGFHGRLKRLAKERGVTIYEDSLISGNSFISSEEKRRQLADRFRVDLVDMNASGILESAQNLNRPCYMIRIVSDYANESAGPDFQQFVDKRSEHLTPFLKLIADAFATASPRNEDIPE